MSEFEVQIIELPPMKIATFNGFGAVPELEAFALAEEWLRKENLYRNGAYRQFGFNNPHPTPGKQEYGYEVWILPECGISDDHNVEIKEFSGGLYAVVVCDSVETIREDWQRLFDWRAESGYSPGDHQQLEEVIDPPVKIEELRLRLYLPIRNKDH